MQAQLAIRRFPTTLAAFVLAVTAALLLGGSLGYVFKPTTTVPGPTRVVLVSGDANYDPNADKCIFVDHHKAC